jgi:hypothetical protein
VGFTDRDARAVPVEYQGKDPIPIARRFGRRVRDGLIGGVEPPVLHLGFAIPETVDPVLHAHRLAEQHLHPRLLGLFRRGGGVPVLQGGERLRDLVVLFRAPGQQQVGALVGGEPLDDDGDGYDQEDEGPELRPDLVASGQEPLGDERRVPEFPATRPATAAAMIPLSCWIESLIS